jgi:hypothetical protein
MERMALNDPKVKRIMFEDKKAEIEDDFSGVDCAALEDAEREDGGEDGGEMG